MQREEWYYEKNEGLTPAEVLPNSHRRVWWKCHEGHSWQTAISKRYSGQNCPFCSGKKAWKGFNDLSTTNPELISEWDFDKNKIPIYEFRPMSNKKVWWVCDKGHSWEAAIAKRTNGEKCPICQGKQVLIGFNDLATTHPLLLSEWDFEKNIGITPYEISKGCHEKVWWICSRKHSWRSEIASRSSGCGCPQCAFELQTSFPEKVLYFYVKKVFPDAISNYKSEDLKPFELDIYLPSLRIGIEYDGERWHQNLKNDLNKNKKCEKLGIFLIRVREAGCPVLSDNLSTNIVMESKKIGECNAVEELFKVLSQITQVQYTTDIDLSRDNAEIINLLGISEKDQNLQALYPNIAKEWDYDRNGTLSPNEFTTGSGKKAWWTCPVGHSYLASIASRVRGRACPQCARERRKKTK